MARAVNARCKKYSCFYIQNAKTLNNTRQEY